MNPGIRKTYNAGADIGKYRIVKHNAADGSVIQAAAAADASIGITQEVGGETGKSVDVCLGGLPDLELGGTVARGAPITSDATGQGVAAIAGNRHIGFALVSGVAGDIITIRYSLGLV